MGFYGDLTKIHFSLPDTIGRKDYVGFDKHMKELKKDLFDLGHIAKLPKNFDVIYFQGKRMFTVSLNHPLSEEAEFYLRMKYNWIDRSEILKFLTDSSKFLTNNPIGAPI